jgi:hypothetical protein
MAKFAILTHFLISNSYFHEFHHIEINAFIDIFLFWSRIELLIHHYKHIDNIQLQFQYKISILKEYPVNIQIFFLPLFRCHFMCSSHYTINSHKITSSYQQYCIINDITSCKHICSIVISCYYSNIWWKLAVLHRSTSQSL